MIRCSGIFLLFALMASSLMAGPAKVQYRHKSIQVPPAGSDEPIRETFSLEAATDYLLNGSLAWVRARDCVSCHTPGAYMQVMPELTPVAGRPADEMRTFFVEQLARLKTLPRERFEKGTRTGQAIYIAAGLAEWDRHVEAGRRSEDTEEALKFVFDLQGDSGTWQSLDCWPPFESSAWQQAIVVARAATSAPGWLKEKAESDPALAEGVAGLKTYLKTTPPPHDYGRVLLLRAATGMPRLIDEKTKQDILARIWTRQRNDGGWSIRDFAAPEAWGRGNRAKKLRAEPDFADPPSDGHMTGLAVLALREAGVPATDERIQRAVQWLLTHQRGSGRWWTRSLNTDDYHFITYSGTAYPLLALARCGALGAD
ncbi:MAG: hypothetical protein AAF492_05460 [Verrucomicrobiota bacterium]